jgi:hypothetical protein
MTLRNCCALLILLLFSHVTIAEQLTREERTSRRELRRPRIESLKALHQQHAASPVVSSAKISKGIQIQSGNISFHDIIPGKASDLLSAITIRVFSERPWKLLLFATNPLQVTDHLNEVSLSRLQIKSHETTGFVKLLEDNPIVIARGSATSPAGELVVADVRLHLDGNDPLGHYTSVLRVSLVEK